MAIKSVRHLLTVRHSSITVNGQTYDSVDEMPETTRRLYEEAMRQVDANGNGIPDAMEADDRRSRDLRHGIAGLRGAGKVPRGTAALPGLDRAQRALATFGRILVLLAAIVVAVGGTAMIASMSASDRSQGAHFYAGIALLLALGWLAKQYASFPKRD